MKKIIIRRYRVPLPDKVNKPESPIKVVIIGDLHNRLYGEGNRVLVEKIAAEHPDLIFSVGDLSVVKAKQEVKLEVGIRLLKRLAIECPVYCIHGNHEYSAKLHRELFPGVYERLKKELDGYNLHLLENKRKTIEVKGTSLTIHGYELPTEYYKKFTRKKLSADEMSFEIGWPEDNSYNMLLAHNPRYFETYAKWGADFVCSGHFHGGMIRLPFIGGLISSQGDIFPKYCCGLYEYEQEERYICVTAGLGTHSNVPRINNPAEFSVVEFC